MVTYHGVMMYMSGNVNIRIDWGTTKTGLWPNCNFTSRNKRKKKKKRERCDAFYFVIVHLLRGHYADGLLSFEVCVTRETR